MNDWRRVETAADWAAILAGLPAPHSLQSWAWGEFKSRWGWRAERWVGRRADGATHAAMQLLSRRIGPFTALYAPKGPVASDLHGYFDAIAHIERRARGARAIWAKLDGDPPPSTAGDCDGLGWSSTDLGMLRTMLSKRGWRAAADQVQFRNTMLTDLRADDATLLARMGSKCRYNVRLSERRGVTVRALSPVDGTDAERLYAIYVETGARDGFFVRDASYYLDAWRAMNATALIAEHDDVALGGLVLFREGARAWYFYGMSGAIGREHMPNHLLQWHAMRWARDNGCTAYDWWGAPDALVETDAMWGVYRFKEAFGAQFIEGLGAWDFAPSRALYRAYTEAMPRILGIMRRSRRDPDRLSQT